MSKKRAPFSLLKYSFKAVLESHNDKGGVFVKIPFNVENAFGLKGQIKVRAWFDGVAYRGSIATMGIGSFIIIVRKEIRKEIGKDVGDFIDVIIEQDVDVRVVDIPDDVAKALSSNKKASDFFNTLSYTNKKEYVVWITSAKKEETRRKRIEGAVLKLSLQQKSHRG